MEGIIGINSLPFPLVFMVRSLFLMICYFDGDQGSLFQQWSAIITKSFACPCWQTFKTVVHMSLRIPFCVWEKIDKIWFMTNGWPDITHNARWSAFASPNKAFALCYMFTYTFDSFMWTRSLARWAQNQC